MRQCLRSLFSVICFMPTRRFNQLLRACQISEPLGLIFRGHASKVTKLNIRFVGGEFQGYARKSLKITFLITCDKHYTNKQVKENLFIPTFDYFNRKATGEVDRDKVFSHQIF